MDTSELRKEYLRIVTGSTGLPGFDTSVPLDVSPLPNEYYLVSNVSRTQTTLAKAPESYVTGYRKNENRVFLNVDVNVRLKKGFNSSFSVEKYVDAIIENLSSSLNPQGYYVKETKLVNMVPMNVVTDTNSIQRMVISFEHWVSKK
ncbi:hypothetical protein OHD16_06700 [Sphingobacterium sp. ML3W]|uniref:hypothetical protein n=1 Tax=Sphingobacterium sp. ML3W TaxID=1538644 RepID=UPI00249AE358|nr:hypothetical protein [Sphingobacterium sp. ML3W]WFA79658.1 hypothetical protein OGI71_26940 [Sphingobacterium sp. ML3W]